jgi:hypothetical protein
VDWDWSARIADFGRSSAPEIPSLCDPDAIWQRSPDDSRYFAPECSECTFRQKSDVFAFALVLLEFFFIDDGRPEILDSDSARALIEECCATDPMDRLTFEVSVSRLWEMKFSESGTVRETD